MEPRIEVWVEEGGRIVFGDQEVRVIEAIAARGTLSQVAASLGMSYRGLWRKIREMEANLGTKLVQSTVGGTHSGSSQLTPIAERLVAAYTSFRGCVGAFARQRFESCSIFLDDGLRDGPDAWRSHVVETRSAEGVA